MKDEIDELNHIGDGRILVTKDELLSLKKKWEIETEYNLISQITTDTGTAYYRCTPLEHYRQQLKDQLTNGDK